MHSLHQHLLNLGQFDVLLVTTLAFHAGRDTTDNDDSVSTFHLVGQIGEVSQLTLTDVATQHGKLTIAMLVVDDNVVGLASLHRERLILYTTTEAEATTATALILLNNLTIDLQHIAIIGCQRVLHLTREG